MNTINNNNEDTSLNSTDIRRKLSFTYDELFKAFVAGDTEGVRLGDEVDREEFEEWFTDSFL